MGLELDGPGFRSWLLDALSGWRRLGETRTGSGAMLIGRVPHVAPKAWLHKIFMPATADEVAYMRQSMPAYADSALALLHRATNGLNLFSGSLYFYGRRLDYERSVDNVFPWDLVTANIEVRGSLPIGSLLVGGSLGSTRGVEFVETAKGEIEAIDPVNWGRSVYKWDSLQSCIEWEIKRLSRLFDERGRVLDQAALTKFDPEVI